MAKKKTFKKQSNAKKFDRNDYAQQVADKLIEKIEAGTAPWQKPWEPGVSPNAPQNAKTGQPYHGANALILSALQPGDSDDPRWVTYLQAKDLGGHVREGQKSPVKLEKWHFTKPVARKDENGKVMRDENGKVIEDRVPLDRPYPTFFNVWHATQCEGLPPYEPKQTEETPFQRHERCEKILEKSGADIRHERGDRAFYSPSQDQITLPEKDQFHSEDGYYATALHELGHWTGHPDRLDRDLSGGFGSESYAKEELRAEISSYMVGQGLAVGHDPGQHAAYAANWVKVLKDDPAEIIRAAKDAEKITEMVMGFEPENTLDQEPETENQNENEAEAVALVAGEKANEPEQPEIEEPEHQDEQEPPENEAGDEPDFVPDAGENSNDAVFGGDDAGADFDPDAWEPEPEPEPEEEYGPSM